MKQQFDPLRGRRGEFRLTLNLTELGERAWDLLALSQKLGFETPQFRTCIRPSGVVEVWAVILEQVHCYDADPSVVVDCWDDQIDCLRDAIGESHHFDLVMLCNLEAYLEPLAVA
jgi:hypothetical protein